jgi:hypothetical protein
MVQLKVASTIIDDGLYKFQFLHGTIKRGDGATTQMLTIKFQFLHGTIKSAGTSGNLLGIIIFQFLHGTIKRNH